MEFDVRRYFSITKLCLKESDIVIMFYEFYEKGESLERVKCEAANIGVCGQAAALLENRTDESYKFLTTMHVQYCSMQRLLFVFTQRW